MHPQNGSEGGELEPAGVQLPPLFFFAGSHRLMGKLALHGVAAGVHGPVGQAGDAGAQPGGNLLRHRGPRRGNVSRPRSRRVALFAGKAGAREDEDSLVGSGLALTGVDALAIHQRVAVQHARSRAQEGGIHVGLLAFKRRRRRQQIWLGRIHPPGVNALCKEVRIDLRPEELAGAGIERVIEGVGLVNPVHHVFLQVWLV